jgi:predicted DNA binding CopG/RHH family protein
MAKKLKPWPKLETEDEVDAFVQSADLSEYDTFPKGNTLTMGELMAEFANADLRFEAKHKDASIHMRLPGEMIEAYKKKAKNVGIPYQRLMRLELQKGLQTSDQAEALLNRAWALGDEATKSLSAQFEVLAAQARKLSEQMAAMAEQARALGAGQKAAAPRRRKKTAA